jgi:hypothetical protein
VGATPGVCQTVDRKPLHIFDLGAAVRARPGRDDFTVQHTVQKGSRWYTVASFRKPVDSIVISGIQMAAFGSPTISTSLRTAQQ